MLLSVCIFDHLSILICFIRAMLYTVNSVFSKNLCFFFLSYWSASSPLYPEPTSLLCTLWIVCIFFSYFFQHYSTNSPVLLVSVFVVFFVSSFFTLGLNVLALLLRYLISLSKAWIFCPKSSIFTFGASVSGVAACSAIIVSFHSLILNK